METSIEHQILPRKLKEARWPLNGLETLKQCPVCGDAKRQSLHKDLIDNTFFCAPGEWQLWRCLKCESAYLDPRPTPKTIGLAYEIYYTHDRKNNKIIYEKLTWARRQRRTIVNGYFNWRFLTNLRPSSQILFHILRVLPVIRRQLDWEYRNLPKSLPAGAKLLDVGCGSGEFLLHAQQAGWNAMGVDPDKAAVEQANLQGLNVSQGDLKLFSNQQHIFDYISLSHVIEHVHDPVADIKNCYRLLKPGGKIWIETPNIKSAGYKKFGRNWRGIEAPRHLVIFNHNSLRQALLDAGFSSPKLTTRPLVAKGMFDTSRNIQNKKPIGANRSTGKIPQVRATFEGLLQEIFPNRHEFITIMAVKE